MGAAVSRCSLPPFLVFPPPLSQSLHSFHASRLAPFATLPFCSASAPRRAVVSSVSSRLCWPSQLFSFSLLFFFRPTHGRRHHHTLLPAHYVKPWLLHSHQPVPPSFTLLSLLFTLSRLQTPSISFLTAFLTASSTTRPSQPPAGHRRRVCTRGPAARCLVELPDHLFW